MAIEDQTTKQEDDSKGLHAVGLAAMRSIMPGVIPEDKINFRDGGFADEIIDIGMISVFSQSWAREGLSLRDRSLVTIALLIAQHADVELRSHLAFGINNGLTKEELEEVVYHSAGYVGYPKAMAARAAGRAVFDKK